MIRRLFVEKKPPFRQAAGALAQDLRTALALPGLETLRILLRYDVEGVPDAAWDDLVRTVFAEPPVDLAYEEDFPSAGDEAVFAVEFLPGQYDQRADSAAQCVELITHQRPRIATATVYVLSGSLDPSEVERVQAYLVNAVDSRLAELEIPETLSRPLTPPADVPVLNGFREAGAERLAQWHSDLGLAMTPADLAFCQQYFAQEAERDPTLTELKLLDTYWSDHCRHTTFLTEITKVSFDEGDMTAPHRAAWEHYQRMRVELYDGDGRERPVCLMDLAVIGMKHLRRAGKLADLEISEEVNAASIVVPVMIGGKEQEWLVMFKNETHNHPTEIEPFGGAATCLGGAIRDPLSGRSYVYQAMRVTGAADPRTPLEQTLPGKLPQRKISVGAAEGYSSYGNQIGLATGVVREIYHPRYVAKRMEIGAVVAAAPRDHVLRGEPAPGDVIVVVGGRTGRDGVGGATGSSKEHDQRALENSAEVQKGDPVCERKLQRLFRRRAISRLIKRCNDFGAGGVAVAIGELAPSLEIDLDALPLKYAGLDGTELALSESQERMAVVLDPADVETFTAAATSENLEAVTVARVTQSGLLEMRWRGKTIVELRRAFLDTNGVRAESQVHVRAPDPAACPFQCPRHDAPLAERWLASLGELNHCSQRGLVERFDSTIGGNAVLHPFGGTHRATPAEAMASLIPCFDEPCATATVMSFGFDPELSSWSPYHGAVCAVVDSVARVVAAGGERRRTRLTFQEYFERLRDDPSRWGKPFAALLGALEAQAALETAAIGGKDSMSGSFHDIDVPPTLVSFAVAPVAVQRVSSPEFKAAGHRLFHVRLPRDAYGLPDLPATAHAFDAVAAAIGAGRVHAARGLRQGGLAVALAEMAFGNAIGAVVDPAEVDQDRLFQPLWGDLLLEVADDFDPAGAGLPGAFIGHTLADAALRHGDVSLPLPVAQAAWEAPLESVFPTQVDGGGEQRATEVRFDPLRRTRARFSAPLPRVVLPVFPGTNCELDSARAFRQAGAEVDEVIFRNLTPQAIAESLAALRKAIGQSQILMLAGGFSAGDEPAGAGKFIAAVLRQPEISEAVMNLLQDRDGLILGVCNGFQALIKTGLLPHGEIRPLAPGDPTLTHNTLHRHVSCYARTKVVSKRSPWLAHCTLGEEHVIAFSHGEGRFVADDATIRKLVAEDQICIQYVDAKGKPTMRLPDNPNGSVHAVEAICSPCGRVFGKMGHTERSGPQIAKNIPGPKMQPLFDAGVAFFQ